MNNEDNTADVRISNWTLATGTKPGAREGVLATGEEHRWAWRARAQVVVDVIRRGKREYAHGCFHATRRMRFAPHHSVHARFGHESRWHASCRSFVRDPNPIQFSQEPDNGWWFAAPPHRGSHSPTRGYGRRASRRLSSTPLSALAHRRSRPLIPTFVKDDGWLRLSAELFIVLRSHLFHSLDDGNAPPQVSVLLGTTRPNRFQNVLLQRSHILSPSIRWPPSNPRWQHGRGLTQDSNSVRNAAVQETAACQSACERRSSAVAPRRRSGTQKKWMTAHAGKFAGIKDLRS